MATNINESINKMKAVSEVSDTELDEIKSDLLWHEITSLYSRAFTTTDIYNLLKHDATTAPAPMTATEFKRLVNQAVETYIKDNNLGGAMPYIADPYVHIQKHEREVRTWKDMPLLKTGIEELDMSYGGGMLPGNLLVLTGGEGSMKTSLALRMVDDYLVNVGERVLFFSLDMEAERIAIRRLLPLANIGYKEMLYEMQRGSDIYKDALERRREVDNGNFRIVDGSYTLEQMKKVILLENPSVVMVDYLTCIEGYRSELDTAREAIKKIRDWKKEYGYTFVTLNQLSEASKANQRNGHINPPAMGGGSSQQAADVKIDLFKDTPKQENVPWAQQKKPRIVATVSKARDAVAGRSFELSYDGPTMTFQGEATEVHKIKETKAIFEPVSFPV